MTILSFDLKFDLDLQPTSTISNGISTPQGEHLCQIILKSMHRCTSYGSDKSRWMHAQTTHRHQTEVVTTMSRSLQAGSTITYVVDCHGKGS